MAEWHGAADGAVRFGVATWFGDVLVRFGYDLFEHEHPWDGEWIDDTFETAALRMRSTGAKLLRVLDELDVDRVPVDAERTPMAVDLAVAYLRGLLDDLAIVIPNCYGTDGRSLPRGDLAALGFVAPDVLGFPTHRDDLYPIVDAADAPALPRSVARMRAESVDVTLAAIGHLDIALAELCPWFDDALSQLQRTVAERAEDGCELLERWSATDWSVIGRATPSVARHLPKVNA